MLNMNCFFSNFNPTIALGTGITTAALVITQTIPAIAKSATEIAAIAIATTVKIENTLGIPGGSGLLLLKRIIPTRC